jgi:hypothetical protein
MIPSFADVSRVGDKHWSNTNVAAHPAVRDPAVPSRTLHRAARGGDHFWDSTVTVAARRREFVQEVERVVRWSFSFLRFSVPEVSLHLPVHNEPQNEQNGQEGRKTNEQYVVLPGHPFYGCPVRVLKHTAGYCTIEDPAHPEFRYEMLVSWLSASPPPPQAPSIAMHDPIPLLLSALDRLVQIIVLKDQQMKDSANERASESSRPVRLGPTTTRTQNSVEGPTILSDTEPDRREGA